MDQWLTAIEADRSNLSHEEKVTRNKPAGLVTPASSAVWSTTGRPGPICDLKFFFTGLTRMVAGGPNTDDVLKCQLKPLNRADYNVSFTDAQWARLQQTFPQACAISPSSALRSIHPRRRGWTSPRARETFHSANHRPRSSVGR